MDRVMAYPGALPRSVDVLSTNLNSMMAIGAFAQAIIGSNMSVAGLQIAPTTPASLAVTIGTGSIYALDQVDASAYSTLGTNSAVITKQGLLLSPALLNITPPPTPGYSQVYLVEATYSDVDAGGQVLPYYNSGNPQQPYAGPANSGVSQFTVRQGVCTISLKAGVAAPTGSQSAPSPDAGYVGLWLITVANGQTTITSANWKQYTPSSFIQALGAVAGIMIGSITSYFSAGTYTYTPSTSGYDLVILTGAGGGGGATSNTNAFSGASGGSGETRWKTIPRVAGQSTTVIIGAGGAGSPYGTTANYGQASTGSSSLFGVAVTSAGGGGGLGSATAGSGGVPGGGGAGGDFQVAGQYGSDGSIYNSTTAGGLGGGTPWGTGMKASVPPSPYSYVAPCGVPGGGGGGAYGSGTYTGGKGGDGICVIIPLA